MQKLGPNAAHNNVLGVSEIPISWAADCCRNSTSAPCGIKYSTITETLTNRANSIPRRRESMLRCPDDGRTDLTIGGLTYVVNAGFPDEIPSTAASDDKANGVSHDLRLFENGGRMVRAGSGDMPDGANRTLLLSENIHKDEDRGGTGHLARPAQLGLTSSGLNAASTMWTPTRTVVRHDVDLAASRRFRTSFSRSTATPGSRQTRLPMAKTGRQHVPVRQAAGRAIRTCSSPVFAKPMSAPSVRTSIIASINSS